MFGMIGPHARGGQGFTSSHLQEPITTKGQAMVDNQHKKIAGYRDLTEEEIAIMNECKRHAVVIGELCTRVENIGGIDKRWAAIAKTDLQKGFMALIRSIAKPETF